MSGADAALLVVDDNPDNRDMLCRRLARRGYRVAEAADGAQALAMLAARPFDLVLLDVMMPVLDGLETLRRLRATRSLAELPVIMATAKDASEDVVQALKDGANDYVTKPIDFPVALARIETQLELKRAVETIRRLELDLEARNRELEGANRELEASNRRMRHDLEAAARIQQAFLPHDGAGLPEVRFSWRYRPCDELAGDTLNVVPLEGGRAGLFIADVSGHGVPAALLSVTISRLLSRLPDSSPLLRHDGRGGVEAATPLEVVGELARRFPPDLDTRQYFTLLYGVFDSGSGEFAYTCAGHPGPIHVPRDGSPAVLRHPGLPIGLLPPEAMAGKQTEHRVSLTREDRIYLFSDGIPEALDPEDREFGVDRLVELLDGARSRPLEEAVAAVIDAVEGWCGAAGPADDVSILALEA